MSWIVGLPLAAQITIGVVFLLVVFGLGFIGKVNIKLGKNIITFGRSAKRTCGDCILLMMAKRERLDAQRTFVINRVLKEQMNYLEQKLIEVQGMLLTSYRKQLADKRDVAGGEAEINKQYRLYQGILGTSLQAIKDEFRRSFKENGFEELSGTEFTHFVKNKVSTIVSLGRDHLFNLYPYEGMIISIDERTRWLDSQMSKVEDICFEIYVRAKEIKIDAHKKVDSLENDFSNEIDELISTKA